MLYAAVTPKRLGQRVADVHDISRNEGYTFIYVHKRGLHTL